MLRVMEVYIRSHAGVWERGKEFDSKVVARKYVELYEEIVLSAN